MQDSSNTESTLIERGAAVPKSLQPENEPWNLFYKAGERLRNALQHEQSPGAEARCHDEAAASRMDGELLAHEPTPTLPDATGRSRIGGRLHLVGSPIF